MGSYKYENETIKGKEYMTMKSEVFYDFFCELMTYRKNTDAELIEHVKLEYGKAKRINRKRIRLKKEKICLTVMYNIMLNE